MTKDKNKDHDLKLPLNQQVINEIPCAADELHYQVYI